jgi:hypothetical protein
VTVIVSFHVPEKFAFVAATFIVSLQETGELHDQLILPLMLVEELIVKFKDAVALLQPETEIGPE